MQSSIDQAGDVRRTVSNSAEVIAFPSGGARPDRPAAGLTVVIPFYNEEDYLAATLNCFASQVQAPAEMLLVDNGSTDASARICTEFKESHPGLPVRILEQKTPGKIFALETACAEIKTEFVAFCDADTLYPPHYLKLAAELFARDGERLVAVMAIDVFADPESGASLLKRYKSCAVSALLAKQCHTGGYGQIFRTSALREAGGYSPAYWPYVLEDHEIMQRILKLGRARYNSNLWCQTSARRADRSKVSWTAFEKLLYHCTPFSFKDWYFDRFLAPRMQRRGQNNVSLRHKPWKA